MKKVIIAGGSGLVGTALAEMLNASGFDVFILSRSHKLSSNYKTILWDTEHETIDSSAFANCKVLINLAGENVGTARWTAERKEAILQSRLKASSLLARAIRESGAKPERYIGAAAVGFYGNRGDEKLNEQSNAGAGFLAEVCKQWEKAHQDIAAMGIPTAILRIGVVFSMQGGALAELTKSLPFAAASVGSGKQYLPWIHIKDLCRVFTFLIENPQLEGTFNTCGPAPATMMETARCIADIRKPLLGVVSVPAIGPELAMGEMASIVTEGQRAFPEELQKAGFTFEYSNLKDCLLNLLSR